MKKSFFRFFIFTLIFSAFLNGNELNYENKIRKILKDVFGIEKFIVNVKFAPRVSLSEEEKKIILPVVPEIEEKKLLKELPPKIDIKIILPERAKIEEKELKNFLRENLLLLPEDKIEVKYVAFAEKEQKNYFYKIPARDIVIYSFILIVLIFLFGPVRVFIKNFNKALKKANIEKEEEISFVEEKPKPLPYFEEKEVPFSFINEENIRNLAFILRKETPERISLVAGFLREGLFKKFLEHFPEDVQEEIILNLSRENEIPYKEVKELEEEIRNKLRLIVGGKEKVIKILEELSPEKREKFLSFLSVEKPELAEELKNMIFSFEELKNFSLKELEFILQHIKIPVLLRALKFSSQELKDKIFLLLSPKTVKYIKEEIKDESITKEISLKAQLEIVHKVRELMESSL